MKRRAAKKRSRAVFPCPACGAEVRVGALACAACGSDDRTGWTQDDEGGLDLPSSSLSDEEYDRFVADELSASEPRSGLPLRTRVVAAVLAVLLTVGAVLLLW